MRVLAREGQLRKRRSGKAVSIKAGAPDRGGEGARPKRRTPRARGEGAAGQGAAGGRKMRSQEEVLVADTAWHGMTAGSAWLSSAQLGVALAVDVAPAPFPPPLSS